MRITCVMATLLMSASGALAQSTMTYRYDALGRLVATNGIGGASATYRFDAAGNRTQVVVAAGSTPTPTPTPSPTPLVVTDYSFEDPNIGDGGPAYQYNPAANAASFQGGAGVSGNGSYMGFPNAPDGHQVGFLHNDAKIVLNFSGAIPGASYRVKVVAMARPGWLGTIYVSVGGQLLATISNGTSFQTYVSAPFTAIQSAGTVELSSTSANGTSISGLDLVQIVPG